eukprot:GILK01002912.1.p1 GENE.GILK01002912.1~~GILK01002912.1.p1  ORF type:complete len:531 (+),score=102.87 GILK01002912.1:42-1634(+)
MSTSASRRVPSAEHKQADEDPQQTTKQQNKSPAPSRVWREDLPFGGDLLNMVILVVLYTLQGIPLGLLLGSVPFILKKHVSYTELGIFSFAAYPYSLKFLWSPIVDSVFSNRVGRRKSWIIPMQITVGCLLMLLSGFIEQLIENGNNVVLLTSLFFALILLIATQDIAVDGWALTILHRTNIGYGSTCQSLGQMFGYLLSFTVFLALHSADFCNKWIRTVPEPVGVLRLSDYMFVCGVAFVVVTVVVWVFKKEEPFQPADEDLTISVAYKKVGSVLKLTHVKSLMVVLLTARIAFAASDSVSVLKLMEKGLPEEYIGMLAVIQFPFDSLFAYLAGRWASGKRPLQPWITGYAFRLCVTACTAMLVYHFPTVSNGVVPWPYLVVVVCMSLLTSFTSTLMFASQCAFFNRVSDETIGGAYVTVLNTVANFGSQWPKFIMLWLVDKLTRKVCIGGDPSSESILCDKDTGSKLCEQAGGSCTVMTDGFFAVVAVSLCIGVCWILLMHKRIDSLQHSKKEEWKCPPLSGAKKRQA